MKNATIKIEKKREYTGSAEKHPYGDFYADGEKYTCWEEELFNKFVEGDIVDIFYTEKPNVSNGITYLNKNISRMDYAIPMEEYEDDGEDIITKDDYYDDTGYTTYPTSELRAGNVIISGKVYEVVLRMVGNGE